jgi:hypothetical protein
LLTLLSLFAPGMLADGALLMMMIYADDVFTTQISLQAISGNLH